MAHLTGLRQMEGPICRAKCSMILLTRIPQQFPKFDIPGTKPKTLKRKLIFQGMSRPRVLRLRV